MTAQDIMTTDVHSVDPETSVEDLARLFVERKVSAMPVVDASGVLKGVVTQGDLVDLDRPVHIPKVISIFDWVLYLESEKNFKEEVRRISARKVSEICTREVVSCSPSTPVTEIAALMSGNRVNMIPVLDAGKVVGVVARLDIIRSMGMGN